MFKTADGSGCVFCGQTKLRASGKTCKKTEAKNARWQKKNEIFQKGNHWQDL